MTDLTESKLSPMLFKQQNFSEECQPGRPQKTCSKKDSSTFYNKNEKLVHMNRCYIRGIDDQ